MSNIGDNIKRLREARGLTQQKLAEIIGAKTYTTITKWEKGENFPKGRDIIVMSNFFNVSSDELLGLREPSSIVSESSYPYIETPISAGLPENIEGVTDIQTIAVPNSIMGKYAGDEDIQMMRVSGESMNRIIPNGSLIAVKQISLNNLKNGDVVVYGDNYSYSVKRFFRAEDKLIFRPDSNDDCFTDYVVHADECVEIVGKVVVYVVELD